MILAKQTIFSQKTFTFKILNKHFTNNPIMMHIENSAIENTATFRSKTKIFSLAIFANISFCTNIKTKGCTEIKYTEKVTEAIFDITLFPLVMFRFFKKQNKEIEANKMKGKLYDSTSKCLNTLNLTDKRSFIYRENNDIKVNIR